MSAMVSAKAASLSFLLALPALVGTSAAENCTYQLSEASDPYYVLGSRVTPQSNSLVIAECGQTNDEVSAAIEAEKRARELAREAELRAHERAASTNVLNDHSVLMEWAKARDQARAEARAAAPSAGRVSGVQELLSEDLASIEANCQAEWGTDYSMIEYCQNNQIKAAGKINVLYTRIANDSAHLEILNRCLDEWRKPQGHDWEMVEYCYDNQSAAYRRLAR
jgi:hypothetical protein